MSGTPRRNGTAAQPSSSLNGWASPLSREYLLSNDIPTNTSQCLPKPMPRVVECAEADHNTSEHGVKGSKPTIRVGVSTEDKPVQHTGPSRVRYQSPSRTIPHNTSQARTPSPVAQTGRNHATGPVCLLRAHVLPCASSKQSSRTNAAPSAGPRSYVGCRFSYEDYKHAQVVEWLERDVTGKEVIKSLVLTAFSQLTVTADMTNLALEADLRDQTAIQHGVVWFHFALPSF
jgi:hypothetical protein